MTRKTLAVALVQERDHGSVAANLAMIEQRVAEAAAQGAKLVLLQELHNGEYFCQHESVAEFDRAEPIRGMRLKRAAGIELVAGDTNVHECSPPVRDEDPRMM